MAQLVKHTPDTRVQYTEIEQQPATSADQLTSTNNIQVEEEQERHGRTTGLFKRHWIGIVAILIIIITAALAITFAIEKTVSSKQSESPVASSVMTAGLLGSSSTIRTPNAKNGTNVTRLAIQQGLASQKERRTVPPTTTFPIEVMHETATESTATGSAKTNWILDEKLQTTESTTDSDSPVTTLVYKDDSPSTPAVIPVSNLAGDTLNEAVHSNHTSAASSSAVSTRTSAATTTILKTVEEVASTENTPGALEETTNNVPTIAKSENDELKGMTGFTTTAVSASTAAILFEAGITNALVSHNVSEAINENLTFIPPTTTEITIQGSNASTLFSNSVALESTASSSLLVTSSSSTESKSTDATPESSGDTASEMIILIGDIRTNSVSQSGSGDIP